MIFLEKKYSAAEYRSLVESRDDANCVREPTGQFAKENECQEGAGSGGSATKTKAKAAKKTDDKKSKKAKAVEQREPLKWKPGDAIPTPFEQVSRNNPTKRSEDGKKIESTSISGAVVTRALGGKEEVDPISVGRHLLEAQSSHRGRPISTTDPLEGDDYEYMVSGIVSQVEAAVARGVGPNFYSPEDRKAQMEEYAKIQPLMRGGRTASGFCVGVEGPNGECEPSEGISPQAEFLFRAAQALTSPEANPFENMLRADKVLTSFFEESDPSKAKLGFGIRMAGAGGGEAIKNFARLQKIIDRIGLDEARRLFSEPPMRVGDFEKYFIERIPGTQGDRYKANDYAVDEVVPLFSIFGPKVGPFFANNNGDTDALTADIWFTRTWGRLSGELIEQTKPSLAQSHATKLMASTKNIPRGELSAIGLDGRQFRTIVSEMKKSGTIPQAVISWAEKREKQYAKDGFPSPEKGNGTQERYELDRLAIAILKNQTRVLKVPTTTAMRSNMIRVMKEASARTGLPVAYMQDILWQDEQDAWGSLGSRTTTTPGEPSLYSDVIRKIVENPSYREKRRERRSAGDVAEPQEYDFLTDQKGGLEQSLYDDFIQDLSDDEFADLAIDLLRRNTEAREEQRNFAALDVERRDADCGRDDGGKFGSGNQCQVEGGRLSPKSAEKYDGPAGWNDTDDDYVYHVTTEGNAGKILESGFQQSRPTVRGGSYESYSKGKAFFTEKSGLATWKSKIEDHLFHSHDDPPPVSIVRVKKSEIAHLLEDDAVGSKDAGSPAYFVDLKKKRERRSADCGRDDGGKFDGGNTCASNSKGESFRGVRQKKSKTQTKVARKLYQMRLSEGKLKDMVRALGGKVSNTLVEIDTTRGEEGVNIFVRDRDNNESHVIHVGYYGTTVFNSDTLSSSDVSKIQEVVKAAMPSKIDDRLWARGTDFPVYVVNDPKTMSEQFGRVTAKQRLKNERRSADCGREAGGTFAKGNDCQESGTGKPASTAWKKSASRRLSWSGKRLSKDPPIRGADKMKSVAIEKPKDLAKNMRSMLPRSATLDDVVTLGGGAIRSAELTVSAPQEGEIKTKLLMPVDPSEPEGWRVYSEVSVFDDGDGGIFVDYGLLDVYEPGDDGMYASYADGPPSDAITARITSVMTERMIDSLMKAEKLGATQAETMAIGAGDDSDKFKGYRLWPQFGFDGLPSPALRERLGEEIEEIGLSDDALLKYARGEDLTIQDIIATRGGRIWWDENGSSTPMTLSFKNKRSLGYRQYRKMQRLLPRLKERNKSRSWIDDFESRDCGRDDGGRFEPKNTCGEEDGGTTATATAPSARWQSSNRGIVKWSGSSLAKDSPISGGEKLRSVEIRRPKELAAAMRDVLPESATLDDVVAIGGGAVRGSDLMVTGSGDVISTQMNTPVDPSEPEGWKVYSDVHMSGAGGVITAVDYGLLEVHPPGADGDDPFYEPPAPDDAVVSRITSMMMERMTDSLMTAERLGAERATTTAIGDGHSDAQWKGYRLWPQFGFDGPVTPRTLSLIEDEPDLTFLSDEARAKWDAGEQLTVQDIIATRKGRLWWDENGSSTNMSFDFSDKSSKGYQQFERMKRLLPRLRERNKSRSWIDDFESRDCGRTPGGTFAPGNECQAPDKDGTQTIGGGSRPRVDNSWRDRTGPVSWSEGDPPPVRDSQNLRRLSIEDAGELTSAMDSVGIGSLDDLVSIGGGRARGADVTLAGSWDGDGITVTSRTPIDRDASPPSPGAARGNTVVSRVSISREPDGGRVMHYASLETPLDVSSASPNKQSRLRIASILKEQMLDSLSAAEDAGITKVTTIAAGDAGDMFVQGYRLWPQFGFDGDIEDISKIPDEIVLKAAGIDIPPPGSTRIPHSTVVRSLRARVKKLTIQQLIATREGERWWDENGDQIGLSIDLTDKESPGYRRLQEAKKQLPRLRERNKSRDWLGWLEELESREADCGRDEDGQFAPKNDCGSDGGQRLPKETSKDRDARIRQSAKSLPESISASEAKRLGLAAHQSFTPATESLNSDNLPIKTDDELRQALRGIAGSKESPTPQSELVGAHRNLEDGHPVDLRIDINAFENFGTYAVTVHEHSGGKGVGKPIGYDSLVRLSGDVSFSSNEDVATQIAMGKGKTPIATVKGRFNSGRDIPSDIDSWTPVGYNPKKAAYFYDKRTGDEVIGGTDAVSVGSTVFVRVPRYAKNPRNAARQYRTAGFWGLELRSADCGRTEDGRFGPKNQCQEEGDGPAAPPSKVRVSGDVASSLDTLKIGQSDAVRLAGAEGGSVFMRPAPDMSTNFSGASMPVLVSWEKPLGGIDYGLSGSSAIGTNSDGEPVLYHSTITVEPGAADTPTKRHAAARAFYEVMAKSIEEARRSGFAEVKFNAAGSKSDKSWKGYTIWPRMGFDAPLPDDIRAKLPESLSHAKSLLDLHATREGTEWWSDNGREVDISFRLGDPGSPQAKIMARWLKKFGTDRRDMALGSGDDWLSPADLARFDELWEEIWDEGDLDDYEYAESRSADCGRENDGKFATKNQCQEEGDGDAADKPIAKATFGEVSFARAKDRAVKSIEDGDTKATQAHISVMLESAKPTDVARALGFEKFDPAGSLDAAVREPPSVKSAIEKWWRGKSAADFAANHLAKLAVAARYVPEMKLKTFDVQTHSEFVSGVLDASGVKGLASRALAKLSLSGVMAACNLKDGRITLLRDRDGESVLQKRISDSGYFSTTHPSHTVVHEYAHTLQHDAIKAAAEKSLQQSPGKTLDEAMTEQVGAYHDLADKVCRRIVADDATRDEFFSAIERVSGYGGTSPLELAAEYWTAVTLRFKENIPILDRYLDAIGMPAPRSRRPEKSQPTKES